MFLKQFNVQVFPPERDRSIQAIKEKGDVQKWKECWFSPEANRQRFQTSFPSRIFVCPDSQLRQSMIG